MIKYQILPKSLFLFLSLLFCLFTTNKTLASINDTVVVKDLSEEFLVFDPLYATYVPYTQGHVTSKSLFMDFHPYRGYYLKINAQPGLSIFLDQKLVYKNTGNNPEYLMLEIKKFFPSGSEKRLLNFYHKDGKIPDNLKIYSITNGNILQSTLLWKSRQSTIVDKEIIFLFFVLILLVFVVLKNRFPRYLYSTLGIGQSGNSSENVSHLDFFTFPMLLILLLNSLGFAYIYAESGIVVPYLGPLKDVTITAIGFLVLFYLKYLYLEMLGLVFQFKTLVKAHFNEIVRVALYMNLLLVPVFSLYYFSELLDWSISYIGFLVIIIGGMLFTVARLLVITFSTPQFNYVYLFSYLCIAEIIPLAFVIKFTLLSNLDL